MYVCMYVCIYVCLYVYSTLPGMYVCFHRTLLVCALFSRRACSHARPAYIIAITRYRGDILPACMCARRYLYTRCRRVPHARATSARFSCSYARPAFMNARSPVARCSMWLHPRQYVAKCLRSSRRPNVYCSFSHTDEYVCSILVGIMRMLPSCSVWSCPLLVAGHPCTPVLCSSAMRLPSC